MGGSVGLWLNYIYTATSNKEVPKISITNSNVKKLADISNAVFVNTLDSVTRVTPVIIDEGNPASTSKINKQDIFDLKLNSKFFIENNDLNIAFLRKVLSHELGHVMSLKNNQISKFSTVDKTKIDRGLFDKEEKECGENYYNLEGCFASSSYISSYYKKFWTGNMKTEYDNIQKVVDKTEFQNQMSVWYAKYKDQFISDIATTTPEEDMAESFSLWVIGYDETKLSDIQKTKIKFFDQFSELVQIKQKFNTTISV